MRFDITINCEAPDGTDTAALADSAVDAAAVAAAAANQRLGKIGGAAKTWGLQGAAR